MNLAKGHQQNYRVVIGSNDFMGQTHGRINYHKCWTLCMDTHTHTDTHIEKEKHS